MSKDTSKITKAVIAAAGYGTRFLPATKNQPKEMLPIVDKPIIQYLVEDAVEAYEQQSLPAHMRAVNRFASGMATNHDVASSAFVIGMALLEYGYTQDVNQYRTQLKLEKDKERTQATIQGVAAMVTMLNNRLNNERALVVAQGDVSKVVIAAKTEQLTGDLDIDYKDLMWDFDVHKEAGAILGSIHGAPTVPRGTSPLKSALSGALSSGSSLAMMGGMMGGGSGAMAGLALGGLIGGVGGIL